MQNESVNNYDSRSSEDVIDLVQLFEDYIRCAGRYWLQFLLVILLSAACAVCFVNWTYEPVYTAKVTYAVTKTGDTAIDAPMAARLEDALTAITESREFKEQLFAPVTEDSLNEHYSIDSVYTENSNFYTVRIEANNYINANILLSSFLDVYPNWVDRSNGTIKLEIVDISEADVKAANEYSLIKVMGMGILAGFLLCIAYSTFYSLTVKTVRKESDMKKLTGQSCVTILPEVKSKKRSNSRKSRLLLANKRLDWGYKQSILSAQNRLEKMMEKNGSQVLLVTSTVAQEGKSLVAMNLAQAFGENEYNTLIIDGDLRNPSVLYHLGEDDTVVKGLTDYFMDHLKPEEIIVHKKYYDIISAGTLKGAISGFASDGSLDGLMTVLRRRYDYIIIDTPPSHLFSDASILAAYADAVVYVVRHDYAALQEIKDGISGFITNKKLLGYIINRASSGFSSYGKYGYGKYGYGRYGNYGGKYKRYIQEEESLNTEDSL